MANFNQRRYLHAFAIVPIGAGKICINKGLVYSSTNEDSAAVLEVEGATNDLFYQNNEIFNVNSDQEIFVVLQHQNKEEVFTFCNIERCFISTEDFDPLEYTRVNIGSVRWAGNIGSVTQKLAGDIYCRIVGTKADV